VTAIASLASVLAAAPDPTVIIDEALALNPSEGITALLRRHQALFKQGQPYVSGR
jgi:hypothetical protein